jgi:hypothetical protein
VGIARENWAHAALLAWDIRRSWSRLVGYTHDRLKADRESNGTGSSSSEVLEKSK